MCMFAFVTGIWQHKKVTHLLIYAIIALNVIKCLDIEIFILSNKGIVAVFFSLFNARHKQASQVIMVIIY